MRRQLARKRGWQTRQFVDRPSHYTATAIEPIDVIEAWSLGFHLGDLQKAAWYLNREISRRQGA